MNGVRDGGLRSTLLVVLIGLAATGLVWRVTTEAARDALSRSLAEQTAAEGAGADSGADAAPAAAARVGQLARGVGRQAAVCLAVLSALAAAASLVWRRRGAAGRQRVTRLLQSIAEGDLESPIRGQGPMAQPWEDLARLASDGRARMQRDRARLDADRHRGFQVLGHMVEGVVAVDSQTRIVLLNPAARHLLGLTRRSLVGHRLVEGVRVPQLVEAVQEVLGGIESREVRVEIESLGERRPLRVQVTTLPAGRRPGALVTVHDESQSQRLEQLRRDFVANVSHELKTPLAAIKGYVETVQVASQDDPQAAAHFLAQINVQCLRLEHLVNDMLQLARAQSGQGPDSRTNVCWAGVAEEAVQAYAAVARANGVRLSIAPPPGRLSVRANREALLTIANNLIGNAIRYTPRQGAVQVGFRMEGDRAALVVQDSGVGIAAEDQPRVFERFYRVDHDRGSTAGGTGLGLAIVKHLVQALQGEIRLHSRPGQGSTFEVLLPAAELPTTAEAGQDRLAAGDGRPLDPHPT